MNRFDQSKKRLANFAKYLPGGVNSNFRMGISPTPLVFERAEGPYLYDVDGNRLIDYYLGMGPMILGHNPESVIEAVTEQLKYGILYAGQSEIEFEAARLFCEIVPCAEMVRFNCAGSEVVQAALRVARAATGRSIIVSSRDTTTAGLTMYSGALRPHRINLVPKPHLHRFRRVLDRTYPLVNTPKCFLGITSLY